jgi:hypothetical protein
VHYQANGLIKDPEVKILVHDRLKKRENIRKKSLEEIKYRKKKKKLKLNKNKTKTKQK